MAEPASQASQQSGRCRDETFLEHCDDRIKEFYEIWKSEVRDGRLPSRRDIDPVKMPHLLKNIMLVDVIPPKPHFRYRLVGTGEVRHRGFDPTGQTPGKRHRHEVGTERLKRLFAIAAVKLCREKRAQ